jgi:hypothetical protein
MLAKVFLQSPPCFVSGLSDHKKRKVDTTLIVELELTAVRATPFQPGTATCRWPGLEMFCLRFSCEFIRRDVFRGPVPGLAVKKRT